MQKQSVSDTADDELGEFDDNSDLSRENDETTGLKHGVVCEKLDH
jgi:hypothetical protein